MSPSPGTRLGPYETLGRIGAGGMGAVYRARDTRVDRIVAVKICHEHLNGRFEGEARAIAALNHPHVCTLYDLGREGGIDYLVMEYVEGESLAARLAKGRLPAVVAIRYAIQIADALAAAHGRGIMHRDLKPANIMVTKAGIKVLDFGLAKTTHNGPTAALDVTETIEGRIVGTPHYMSPEQAMGRELDARSDIFSFGLVLYEMLTGRRAFDGDNAASVMAGILEREPPLIGNDVPPAVQRLLGRCLAKDPDDRWHGAHDLKTELEWIAEAPPEAPARERSWAAWLASAVFAAAAAITLMVHLREAPEAQPVIRFELSTPASRPLEAGDRAAVSPDGKQIVFSAGRRLFLRSLDSTAFQELPGTDGGVSPSWSPDGRYIAYEAYWKLMKVSPAGGPPVFLRDLSAPGRAWNRDGTIIAPANARSPLMRMPETGGTPAPLTTLDAVKGEITHAWPSLLPDGRHFLFTIYAAEPANGGVFVGSMDSPQKSRLLPEQTNAQYTEPGYILFGRGSNLMAQAFDARRLQLTGDAVTVAEGLFQRGSQSYGGFSASAGVLVYAKLGTRGPKRIRLVGQKGDRLQDVGPPADYSTAALSPDGRAVAAEMPGDSFSDIWVFDLTRGGSGSRLTSGGLYHTDPTWSPDGREIAFIVQDPAGRVVHRMSANGTGKEERLVRLDRALQLAQWTDDGRFLILAPFGSGKPAEIWAAPLADLGHPFPLLTGPFNFRGARVSPDGKWIAYHSDETGRNEVYVQDFPPKAVKRQISTAGGVEPKWRADGRKLFYLEGSKMMSVDVNATVARFDAGLPKPLFEASLRVPMFASSSDGRKFLLIVLNEESGPLQTFNVVLNWRPVVKR